MKNTNDQGEPYVDEHMTTFSVLHPLKDHPYHYRKKPVKIRTTRSEARFHQLIDLLEKEKKIDPLTRLTAEYLCVTQGFRLIDFHKEEQVEQ